MKYTIPYDDKITLPNIKKVNTIGIDANNLVYDSQELNGQVIISGEYSLDQSKDIMEFKHDIPVSFLIDDETISPHINIANFKYELIPGRGIEVMFDLDVLLGLEEGGRDEDTEQTAEEATTEAMNEPKKTDEEEIKEFQDKIDETLENVLNERKTDGKKTKKNGKDKKKTEEKRIPETELNNDENTELKEESKALNLMGDEKFNQIVEELTKRIGNAFQCVRDEQTAEDEVPDETKPDLLTASLEGTKIQFDTGFVPRENDKFTTYKIIMIENGVTVDELLNSRNLSKALLCTEYQTDKKIILKIEND